MQWRVFQQIFVMAACLAFITTSVLPAEAIVLSGATELVSPPTGTSLANGNYSNNSAIRIFKEKQNYILAGPLAANWTGGTLNRDKSSTEMAQGLVLNSHFIHFDHNLNRAGLSGQVRFDGMILGLIWEDNALIASDFLGLEGIAYPNSNGRGFWGNNRDEINSNDFLDLTDPYTIDFTMLAGGSYVDQLRVVTAPVPAPEPSTLMLATLGAGILGFCSWRRGRRK